MTKINRVGERNKANNGQWMEIIEYFGYNNITVKFEDETIVTNKAYGDFKKGYIKNPNYNPQILINRIGKLNLATNGQWMEIIEYFNSKNITVKFEDGMIVKNRSYDKFKNGNIQNPNHTSQNLTNRAGERKLANNGQWMEITEYFGYNNITVKFEDGTIVTNKGYGSFQRGNIANPNYNQYSRVGEKRKANNGQWMKIIEYFSAKNITVKFEDGTIVYNKSYSSFKIGQIANPSCKIASGISVNEFTIYYYLRKYGFIKAEQGSLKNLGFGQMELDCYHPDYKIAIEYDGDLHATKQNNDKRKNKACKQNGITIIRIREPKCPVLNDNSIEYPLNSNDRFSSSFENALKKAFKYINSITDLKINENISFKKDKKLILKDFNNTYINKYVKLRIGERNLANNGQWMEIIDYISKNNITIRFEDGTIVYHKCYGNFKTGKIANPNYNPYNRVGKKRKANNGQWMEIIEYINSKNITVRFEDGSVVYNKSYECFKIGNIANHKKVRKNTRLKNRIGETNFSNNGQKMTIIEYINYSNITVQFEDGTIVKNRQYIDFKKGQIANPNFKKVA